MRIASEFVDHFSTKEMLEIKYPLLKDSPDELRKYVEGIRKGGTYKENYEKQKAERSNIEKQVFELLPVDICVKVQKDINAMQTYMTLRETVKYYFIKEYGLARDALEILEKRLNLKDGDIYSLYPREIQKLVENPNEFRHLIKSRQEAYANYQGIELPNVIFEKDIDSIGKNSNKEEFISAEGTFLASGNSVEGVVINLDEVNENSIQFLIDSLIKQGKRVILVAKQMNLSHDPYINQADGLILENAGMVSHGAQRARELGKGALGGIKTSNIKTGTEVLFDPQNRVIRKI